MELPSQAREALAALAAPSQHARLIRLDAPLPGLVVERFTGHEAVCASFRFEIDVLSTSAFLEPDTLLAQPLRLHLQRADGGLRTWHGLCTEVMPLGADGGLARYRLVLSPWTSLLIHRRNALIFQDLDVRGVLEQVFDDYPEAVFRFDVRRPLPVRAMTTQYRETDGAFVTRLLAENGLAWHFEHGPADGDDAGHTLVIADQQAERQAGESLRFHRIDGTEQQDAIDVFSEQRQITPNQVHAGSWSTAHLATVIGRSATEVGALPGLEIHAQPRSGRFDDQTSAQREAEHRLDALRLPDRLFHGAGSARALACGAAFPLVGHAQHVGERFVPVHIDHLAVNNLGAGIVDLLGDAAFEHGSYRNRFAAVPADTPIAPVVPDRPVVHGPQTARVVGLPDSAVTASRDHQVRIQFAWQRGAAPNAGGLTDTASAHAGHAPGDATSGTWVPVAEWIAGPNWGSHFLPRVGAEVLVEFLHGDIDQPRITGQLYNGEVAPPFAGGIDGASNHPGTLSGLHTQAHDGAGTQQWVLDDTPGQLRTRLHTSLADSRLELGYLIQHQDAQRGALHGQGVALTTTGWSNVHAAQGLLLSTTARPGGASTQLDVAEAVAQLKGAERTTEGLHDTLVQQQVPGFDANDRLTALREALDPEAQGRYSGSVRGQSAMKPAAGSRDPGEDPVERFADARLVAESPESIALATQKSAVAYAGGALHLTVQDDAHLAAGQTIAWVSGQHTALYAHAGPLRAIAANGPVTLQAHTGELELLADQSVTVTATDARIDVLAQTKIVLQAGQTTVTLEGGDITFACPGEFTVKASQHPFLGGETVAAPIAALPDSTIALNNWIEINHRDPENEPFSGQAYKIFFAGGQILSGKLDTDGHARHESVPDRAERVEYEPRTPEQDDPPEPLDKLISAAQSRLG
ncbi:type VI secretion system Vgr family protein [Luteimonas terrae]|uniref:Type VI secretion system VgrG family protein n=1 Tax=Luteimonas terrae TaxID=1530191 RepID=A0ABU1XX25_9GAMM|nr:type VI secretion system Vgr family protein [Luteimonas terrae]MDR7192641.1 type VI secretion system VgrG family protein [Luteimonas terrae]